MATPPLLTRALFALALASGALAQPALPPEPVSLQTATAFRPLPPNWQLASGLAGDPRRDKTLAVIEGTGVLVCNPGKEKADRGHLFTAWDHGDIEVDLEFLLTPGSNSGVYLQGRYEVQLFDSWSVRSPTSADSGGLYVRWDAARGKDKERFEGAAPRANAARAPGLWQKLRIEFQAPRFDAAGKKTRNARFVKVVLNGFTIHENVEVTGPTRSAAYNDEAPLGPLMIQGDHGSVALRRLAVKRLDARAEVPVADLRYKLYSGDFKQVGAYDERPPTREGTPERFAHTAVEKSGRFALVFTGAIDLPRAGAYRFEVQSGSMARLAIDGRDVVLPLERGSQPGVVTLPAGKHTFRLDLVHTSNARPNLELFVEGPGFARRALTARDQSSGDGNRKQPASAKSSPKKGASHPVEVKDRIVLQRGFVPFDPRKRLYAASVGTPAGVHYAYDFDAGALLRGWRGNFIDASQMWEGRGNDQVARPTGPVLTFGAKPTVALIEYTADGDWPDQPDALFASKGYQLEADGQPVFLSSLADLSIRDRIAPAAEGKGLARTIQVQGNLPSWSAWVLLAEADTLTRQPDGSGWIVGDREWYLDWPSNAPRQPIVRSVAGKQQLAVPLTRASLEQPIAYSIVW